ncbi:toll-like receptor 13 [Ptychodera flava]|uniref:toll-like receptor 13 n=1 Tax=Ptychodera flava TaxID=63121 RepID=UPI00396A31A1
MNLQKICPVLLYLTIYLQSQVLTADLPLTCQVHHLTHVTCYRLSKLPPTFPSWTTHLQLFRNDISSLEPRAFAKLGNLKELGLIRNFLTTLKSQSFYGLDELVVLSLGYNNISTLESMAFGDLHNLQTLDLCCNNLDRVQGNIFSGLSNLTSLDLNFNFIKSIYKASFSGLTSLSVLNLNSNNISRLPNGVFDDLISLRTLDLGSNHLKCLDDTHFNPLVNIQTIILDELNFSKCAQVNFVHFTKLKTLSFRRSDITDDLLRKVWLPNKQMRHVDLSFNNIESPESGALLNFKQVTSLDLSHNPLLSDSLERMLRDLEDSSISALKLERLGPCREYFLKLRPSTFRWLHGTELEDLNLSRNNLTILPENAFIGLNNLKYLHLYDSKVRTLSPNAFYSLTNLTALRLGYNQISDIEDVKAALKNLKSLKYLDLGNNNLTEISPFAFEGVPKLEKLVLTKNQILSIHQDSFQGLSNINELDLTRNYILHIPNSTFSALPSLRILKLRNNALLLLDVINGPFRHLNNLTELSISYSMPVVQNLNYVSTITELEIGNDYHLPWVIPEVESAIANFTRLEVLDIQGGRDIITLPKSIPLKILRIMEVHGFDIEIDFADLAKYPLLEEITIKTSDIDVKYKADIQVKLLHLKTLILHELGMTGIDTRILDTAPTLETFEFSGNPLDCSCNIEEFLHWMRTNTKVWIEDVQGITCERPLEMRLKTLDMLDFGTKCETVMIVSASITCAIILIAIGIILIVRYRWYLRLAIFLTKLRCGCYKLAVDHDNEHNKKYDAFVVYNRQDEDWVMGQLRPHLEHGDPQNFKLCLHERDFMPGTDIFENILDSIDNSHKTVLILSPHFAESEWCYFEMRMAQTHLFESKRDVIVMILLEDIPDEKMPRVLRNMLLTKRYLIWPEDRMGRQLFWQKLQLELRSESRVNRVADV